MASAAVHHPRMQATALMVYNLPPTVDEEDVRSIFPSAQSVRIRRHQTETSGSQSMCTVHFDNSHECQKIYAECQNGKTVGGRMLHVEFSSSWNTNTPELPSAYQRNEAPRRPSQSASYEESYSFSDNSKYSNQSSDETAYNQNFAHRSSDQRESLRRHSGSDRYAGGSDRYEQPKPDSSRSGSQRSGLRQSAETNGCTLTVSNLPYSATEQDVRREFVDAFKVILNLNDQGQSRGVAQLTFPTPELCNAALYACNQKTMNGRTLRGRIQRDGENGQSSYHSRESSQRDQSGGRRDMTGSHRPYGDQHRDYSSRNEYSGTQRGGYGNQRAFGGNRDYNNRGGSNQYRDFGNRRGGPGTGSGGGRMNDYHSGRDARHSGNTGGHGNRFGQRDSRDERRDRSPNRGEPVRGYGAGKGPRITSAVIRGNRDRSSSSESSSDD